MEEKVKVKEKALKNIAEEFNESSKGAGENLGSCALQISQTTRGLVDICLSPFNMVIWSYDNIKEKFIPLVSKKLHKIPNDNIQKPKTSIAGPTIEALRFASDEPELQNMFANLLATAMDKKTANSAHPSFVEIIKQLSPDEARIIDYLKNVKSAPIIDVWQRIKGSGDENITNIISNNVFHEIVRNFSLLGYTSNCTNPNSISVYIDNLCRLKLCEIPHGPFINDKSAYEDIEKNKFLQMLIQKGKDAFNLDEDKISNFKPEYKHKVIYLTSFGSQFINACIVNKDEETEKDPETSSG